MPNISRGMSKSRKMARKKMDWFYAEKAHETVCICDWVFGWGVVISFVEGHLFGRNGTPFLPEMKEEQLYAKEPLRRATPPLKVSFWVTYVQRWACQRVLVLRGDLYAGSLVFFQDPAHRRTHAFWLVLAHRLSAHRLPLFPDS